MRGERRPFSHWDDNLELRGEDAHYWLLREAMSVPEGDDPRVLTHGFHAYPARLPPHLARVLVATAAPGAVVLDPFCGSGTVLIEARMRGCRVIGRDINPLAVRIARLRTSVWTEKERMALETSAASTERRARTLRDDHKQKAPPASARGDFEPHVAWELAALRDACLGERDARRREALLLCLSSMLVKFSRREGMTGTRRSDKRILSGHALRFFVERARELSGMLADAAVETEPDLPPADVQPGDARDLAGIPDRSVDLVVSSPPYVGHYRYLESSRICADWLGIHLEEPSRQEIGARGAVSGLDGYRKDMAAALTSMHRVLAPVGRVFLIVGDAEGPSGPIDILKVLDAAARSARMRLVASASGSRPEFGPEGPRREIGPKREHLVLLVAATD